MTVKERISQWVDAHEQDMIRDIARLVAVKSVRGEPEPGAPGGQSEDTEQEPAGAPKNEMGE